MIHFACGQQFAQHILRTFWKFFSSITWRFFSSIAVFLFCFFRTIHDRLPGFFGHVINYLLFNFLSLDRVKVGADCQQQDVIFQTSELSSELVCDLRRLTIAF